MEKGPKQQKSDGFIINYSNRDQRDALISVGSLHQVFHRLKTV